MPVLQARFVWCYNEGAAAHAVKNVCGSAWMMVDTSFVSLA